jgi:hypothetical protein
MESANLFMLRFNALEDIFKSRLAMAAVFSRSLVFGKSIAQTFRAVVPSISKWFMDALQSFRFRHEHLRCRNRWSANETVSTRTIGILTRSNAVEHARGWVATKIGLAGILNNNALDATRS